MQRCAIVLLAAALLAPASQAAAPARNLAYEDDFVWYLAGRLTTELQMFQDKAGVYKDMGPQERMSLLDQYQILYHNFLLECDGPLPEVAKVFEYYDFASPAVSKTGLLVYVSRMDGEFWPALRAWNNRNFIRLVDKSAEGNYGFFPECIVSPFRNQNPQIMKNIDMTARKARKSR